MTENKNDKPKREVLILTYGEYKQRINEGIPLPPGNFKIVEKDKEKFIRDVTAGEEGK